MSSTDRKVAGIGFATTSLLGAETAEAAIPLIEAEYANDGSHRVTGIGLSPAGETLACIVAAGAVIYIGKQIMHKRQLISSVLGSSMIFAGSETAEAAEQNSEETNVVQIPEDPTRFSDFELSAGLEAGFAIAILAVLYASSEPLRNHIRQALKSLKWVVFVAGTTILATETAEAAEPRPAGDNNNAAGLALLTSGLIATALAMRKGEKQKNSSYEEKQFKTDDQPVKYTEPQLKRINRTFDPAKSELAEMRAEQERY